jgi:murein DD-endopeptidase MepM/ murein hydrolase activator NlpD
MIISGKKTSLLVASLLLMVASVFGQHINYSLIPKKDSTNIYQQMLNDQSDDLMENFPADDIYNNIWTSARVNPYKISINEMPDSVLIDCSHFIVPVPGGPTSHFGPRRYRFHYGIDLRLNVGDTVRAAFSGKVRIIEYEARGYGNYVVIRHDNGLETVYGHLSAVLVNLNQPVKAGEIIAYGGNTGRSTGPHLHFEVRYLGNAINPSSMIDFNTGHVHDKEYLLTKKKSFYYQHDSAQVVHTSRYYTAKKGDTVSKIAARNGMSAKALAKLNGLTTKSKIKAGQSLRIR